MKAFLCALLLAAPLCATESVVTIPGVVHSDRVQTDLALYNPNVTPDHVEITLLRPGQSPQIRTLMLDPGELNKIENAIPTLFGEGGSGSLQIRSMSALAINARQQRGDGGWFLAPTDADDQIGIGDTAECTIRAGRATTLAIVALSEVTGAPATVALEIAGHDGTPVRSISIDLRGFETTEVPIAFTRGREQLVRASVVRGGGRVAVRGALFADDEATTLYPAVNAVKTRHRPVAPGTGVGTAVLKLTMKVPATDRPDFVQHRGEIEANGFRVAADGSAVTFPDYIPAGWRIRIGAQTAIVSMTGKFTIRLTPGLPAQGEILDAVDPQPLASFSLSQLSRPVVVQLPFSGVCNMNTSDALVPNCHDPSTASKPGTIAAEGITYPPKFRADDCEIGDGFVKSSSVPLVSYLGSTCNVRVVVGCCPNEGGWLISKTICCVKNHRGRFCQELSPGDIAILGGTSPISVDLGQEVTFTVHNNGCTGDSAVAYETDALFSLGGVISGQGYDGATVKHYDPDKLAQFDCDKNGASAAWGIWIGDRTMTYDAPKCTSDIEHVEDMWTFGTDGESAILQFDLKHDNLYQFVDTGQIFSTANAAKDGWHIAQADVCPGLHVHGKHPCTGAADPNPTSCGQGRVVKVP